MVCQSAAKMYCPCADLTPLPEGRIANVTQGVLSEGPSCFLLLRLSHEHDRNRAVRCMSSDGGVPYWPAIALVHSLISSVHREHEAPWPPSMSESWVHCLASEETGMPQCHDLRGSHLTDQGRGGIRGAPDGFATYTTWATIFSSLYSQPLDLALGVGELSLEGVALIPPTGWAFLILATVD